MNAFKRLLKSTYNEIKCKTLGHKFAVRETKELIHPPTSNKIPGYVGRVKETIVVSRCIYCNQLLRTNYYDEYDNFFIDAIPKD